jgi:hypothetical protein
VPEYIDPPHIWENSTTEQRSRYRRDFCARKYTSLIDLYVLADKLADPVTGNLVIIEIMRFHAYSGCTQVQQSSIMLLALQWIMIAYATCSPTCSSTARISDGAVISRTPSSSWS